MPVLLVFTYTCELDLTTSARVRRCSSLVHSLVPWAGNDVFRQVIEPCCALVHAHPMSAPAPAPPVAPVAAAAPEPLPYAFSTGNAFASFSKFNGKNYFAWRRNMETQLKALGQWEVVNGTITAPAPVAPAHLYSLKFAFSNRRNGILTCLL